MRLETPLNKEIIGKLKAGSEVLLSGKILTARDQAHKKLWDLLKNKKGLPVNLKGSIIYYVGPTNSSKHKVIGACGPTTSSRMDKFTPSLINLGIMAMIGKGRRSPEVIRAIRKNKIVYFLAPSGLGALLAQRVVSKKCLAFKELGPEAIFELEVKDFPLIVGVDAKGKDIYKRRKR